MNQPSAQRGTDLSALFEVATQALAANQSSLNQADTENQNHGDNMQAALSALMSTGPMAQKPHRQQSGQLVANALLQAIAGMSQQR